MNRREILKFSLLSPLLVLFKSRKSGASTGLTEIPVTFSGIMPVTTSTIRRCPGLKYPVETTGTSSEGPISYYDGVWIHLHDPNSKYVKELPKRKIADIPIGFWTTKG